MSAPPQGFVAYISGVAQVSVTNTPAVSLAGTPVVSLAGTPAVSISGTPIVSLAGTPTVSVAGTATVAGTVSISGTPAVTIANTNTVAVSQLTVTTVATGINVAISASTNILSSSYTPPAPGRLRITFAANASGTLFVVIMTSSATVTYALNGGNALVANAIYAFEVPASTSYSYNIQYGVAATAFYQVDFIPA